MKLSQAFVLLSSGFSPSRKLLEEVVKFLFSAHCPWANNFENLTTYRPCGAICGWGLCLGSLGAQDGQRTICYVGLEIAQKYCLSSGNLEVGEL